MLRAHSSFALPDYAAADMWMLAIMLRSIAIAVLYCSGILAA